MVSALDSRSNGQGSSPGWGIALFSWTRHLKCPCDQIFEFHFFTFSCPIRLSYSPCQISIHYEHQKSFCFNI